MKAVDVKVREVITVPPDTKAADADQVSCRA
jgi:hypothetical protein